MHAASVGGFATAAYLGHGLGKMDQGLADICEHPDQSDLRHIIMVREAWSELITSCRHLRIFAKAVAAGVIMENDNEDLEAIFEKSWKQDVLNGTATANDDGLMKWQVLERDLENAVVEKIDSGELDDDVREMVEQPEDHLEIVRLWAKVEWMKKWTFQRLFSRALDRDRFVQFIRESRDSNNEKEQVRVRSHLNPFSTVPHVVIPQSSWSTLSDREYTWVLNSRIGREQPAVAPISGGVCSCKRQVEVGDGHHLRVCPCGGGPMIVHNDLRDRVHACIVNAGVSAQTEKPQILMDGNERPGDVVASGIGRGGSDLVIDLCCVDPHSQCSNAKRRKRARVVGAAASDAKEAKRNKRGGPHNWRMEDRVAAQGMEFLALGMEISAAPTPTCAN